jgi:hypothetical protein
MPPTTVPPAARSLVQHPPGHDHEIADVTGLQAALNASGGGGGPHQHPTSDVTGLDVALTGKAATVHAHAQADVTGLGTALAAKADTGHTHVIANVASLQAALDAKAATSHNHDAAYLSASAAVPTVRLGTGTANSTTFLRGDQTWAVPAGGGGASKDDQYYRQVGTTPLERWYVGGQGNATALTTGAPTINVLRALPFVSTRGGILDRIGVAVTTFIASGVGRCGIYAATSDVNLYPNSLVVDAGQILTATNGMKAATVNVALAANTLYWLVYVAGTAAATIRCLSLAGCQPIFGLDNALGTAPGVGISVNFTYGALPATFPASGAVISAVPVPAIGVRFSA